MDFSRLHHQALSRSILLHAKYNLQEDEYLACTQSITVDKPVVDVVIPNYNNERFIARVLDSILAQKLIDVRIKVFDNHSSDRSWDIISQYAQAFPAVSAIRISHNSGPHIPVDCLIKSSSTEFVLLASGNDVLADDKILWRFYCFLKSRPMFNLVYGRNSRGGRFSEPAAHAFTIVPKSYLIEDLLCCFLDITILYTSGEPLWGLYRSSHIKHLPIIRGYGSDHAFISALGTTGGIYGMDLPARVVSPEARDHSSLRKDQDQSRYNLNLSGSSTFLPSSSFNFMSMIRTYRDAILQLQGIESFRSYDLFKNVTQIMIYRFGVFIKDELERYPLLFDEICRTSSITWLASSELKRDYSLYKYIQELFLTV